MNRTRCGKLVINKSWLMKSAILQARGMWCLDCKLGFEDRSLDLVALVPQTLDNRALLSSIFALMPKYQVEEIETLSLGLRYVERHDWPRRFRRQVLFRLPNNNAEEAQIRGIENNDKFRKQYLDYPSSRFSDDLVAGQINTFKGIPCFEEEVQELCDTKTYESWNMFHSLDSWVEFFELWYSAFSNRLVLPVPEVVKYALGCRDEILPELHMTLKNISWLEIIPYSIFCGLKGFVKALIPRDNVDDLIICLNRDPNIRTINTELAGKQNAATLILDWLGPELRDCFLSKNYVDIVVLCTSDNVGPHYAIEALLGVGVAAPPQKKIKI